MSLLPDLDGNGKLKPEKCAPKTMMTTGRKQSFMTWNNLLVGRCPKCDNYLEESGNIMQCTSKSGGERNCEFKILKERMRELKMEIASKKI